MSTTELPGHVAIVMDGNGRCAAQEVTRNNTGVTVQLCLNYGGRGEIAHAGKLQPADVTEDVLSSFLYQPQLPPVDLVIRTGGESRLSNFLLWQAGSADIAVTGTMWPDFTGADLRHACLGYSGAAAE